MSRQNPHIYSEEGNSCGLKDKILATRYLRKIFGQKVKFVQDLEFQNVFSGCFQIYLQDWINTKIRYSESWNRGKNLKKIVFSFFLDLWFKLTFVLNSSQTFGLKRFFFGLKRLSGKGSRSSPKGWRNVGELSKVGEFLKHLVQGFGWW